MANIPVFVDKFLNRMALGHLSFDTLYHLSGQIMLLSIVCSGVGVCKSILAGRTLGDVLPFYIASFFGLYAYFSISTVVDVSGKKRILKVNLVDYLENHLSPRIDITRQDIEMLYGESVFEEKRESRTGGSRGRRRRTGRSAVLRPQEQRTLELMPIGNRMAAGGEDLADTDTLASQPQAPEQMPAPPLSSDSSTLPDSAAVTEEELEALLKEFLTS